MRLGTIDRLQLAALVLGGIAAAILVSIGRTELALPLLGGVVWGVFNVSVLRRLTEHIRPDRPRRPARIAFDVFLKLAMYGIGVRLLWGRPAGQILTAGAGFTVVLLVMFLRSLGQAFVREPEESGTLGGE